ncbi:MAG TPA: hypothetical protein VGI67_07185 [Thermoleophilaceae bacterium]
MKRKTIAAATIGLALVGGTAPAEASTVAVNAPCYIQGAPVTASGTGFTASGPINFSFDGQLAAGGTADTAGNFTQPLTAPLLSGNAFQHTYTLTAQDLTTASAVATTNVTVTKQAASVSPHRAKPSRKVKFGVHGMPPGGVLYLHYVFHGKQRFLRKLGKAKAPCGTLTVKKRFFPVRRPAVGTWTFQFDNRKKYSKHTLPRIAGPVTIFNTFK